MELMVIAGIVLLGSLVHSAVCVALGRSRPRPSEDLDPTVEDRYSRLSRSATDFDEVEI